MGKYTPNLAVHGDIGWIPTQVKQWKSLGRLWCRFKDMSQSRINKRIFEWSISSASTGCKNWAFKFKAHMTKLNMECIFAENAFNSKNYIHVLNNIHAKQLSLFKELWRNELDRVNRPNGSQSKLRTYRIFMQTFGTETYVSSDIRKPHRSTLAKCRGGIAPIKIETGRYENLPVADRKCFVCDTVESECHVICECPVYEDLRNSLFNKAKNVVPNSERGHAVWTLVSATCPLPCAVIFGGAGSAWRRRPTLLYWSYDIIR